MRASSATMLERRHIERLREPNDASVTERQP